METNAETRAEKTERVKAKFAAEGKAAPEKAKGKVAKGKTNVIVVKETKSAAPGKMSVEQAEKKLTPLGQEINARFEKIEQLEGKADDHRLAAAINLENAKKICVASGIKFKEWVAENVKQSYETVRKLAAVGASPNPQLALEDMRKKNKEANAKLRNKQKTGHIERKLFGPVDVLSQAKPEEALKAVKKWSQDAGLVVISETEHKELRQAEKSAQLKKEEPLTVEAMKLAFASLPAREKMDFVTFAATAVGYKLVSALDVAAKETVAAEDDPLAIPAGLRRTRKPG